VKFPDYLAAAVKGYDSQPPTGILTNPGNDVIGMLSPEISFLPALSKA
jgi:hypothetical protein